MSANPRIPVDGIYGQDRVARSKDTCLGFTNVAYPKRQRWLWSRVQICLVLRMNSDSVSAPYKRLGEPVSVKVARSLFKSVKPSSERKHVQVGETGLSSWGCSRNDHCRLSSSGRGLRFFFFQILVLHFHRKKVNNRVNKATNRFLRVFRSIRVLVREVVYGQRARMPEAKGIPWWRREAQSGSGVIRCHQEKRIVRCRGENE